MTERPLDSAPGSPIRWGLRGRCPRCGQGRLFNGFLTLAPACSACELDYSFADSADGPAVFIILIVGFLVVGLALFVEFTWSPPLWVHALIWVPAVIGSSLAMLRPLKGLFVAVQFRTKAAEGGLTET